MADSYTYQKKRKEFGRHGQFEDTDTKIVGSIPPDPNQTDFFMMRDPNTKILSNLPVLSQHFVSFKNSNFLTFISIGQHGENPNLKQRYEPQARWLAREHRSN